MLTDAPAYCVKFLICLFRPALAPAVIYQKTAKAKLYWIYNLIRAVFHQNLNVYLRKTCIIVLFKVLPN